MSWEDASFGNLQPKGGTETCWGPACVIQVEQQHEALLQSISVVECLKVLKSLTWPTIFTVSE